MELLERIRESVIYGRLEECIEGVSTAIEAEVDVELILNDGLVAGMSEVGRRFKDGVFFVPEVLIAARAMNGGMGILEPILTESGVEPKGRLVLGTVKDDIHDIGKNLVGMMLKGAGYEIIDLGHDVTPAQFVESLNNGMSLDIVEDIAESTLPLLDLRRIKLFFQ